MIANTYASVNYIMRGCDIIISLHSQHTSTDSDNSSSDDTDYYSTAEGLNDLEEDSSPTAGQHATATDTTHKLSSQKQQPQSEQC